MDQRLLIGAGGAVAGFVLAALVLTPGTGGRMGMPHNRANIDQHFIEQMIPHHEGAIEMAELALEKSSRPEIRSLAEGIIEAQTREINDMRAWYEAWFGSAPVTGGRGMQMHMHGMEGDLDVLKAAQNFDNEFLSQMIVHHEMAVMMATMLAAATERTEMKTLADQIITSQNREIQMMRGWLNEWN